MKSNINDMSKNITKKISGAGKAIASGLDDLADDLKGAAALSKSVEDIKNGADTRARLFQKICTLIPNKVNNGAIVDVLDLMRKEQKLLKKDFSRHLSDNRDAFKKHLSAVKKADGYIEDQNRYTDMAYGDATMQYSGCEIFATFNAIRNITGKVPENLSEMISEYEKDGMVLNGKFGTAPKAISDFLRKKGYKTEMTTEESRFDDMAKKAQSLILTMYNDKDDLSQEIHTVNISKESKGYVAHNVYCNGKVVGPYKSVSEVIRNINGGKARGISLIGISK